MSFKKEGVSFEVLGTDPDYEGERGISRSREGKTREYA